MKTLKRYLLNVLLGVFCIVYTANAQTEVSNTVTLAQALANAYTLGGNQTITFNIPGPPPYIINTTGLNLSGGSLTSLVIDATTQPGWTAGKPVVILRGPGNGNGFNVGMSNVTIKGLIVQNFQNGYSQYNGTNNVIEGSWFGLDETGGAIAGTLNTDYGIVVHGSTSTIAIGSKTDFSATTRNVISGNGIAGVYFNGIASGSYIGNSFIGTDVTGTIELGNGTGATKTEEQHGVRINSTPSVTIKNNLISANQSGGIDVLGDKSSGLVITGNKIGTDITGNLPMGNRTFGIRIKGSNNHTIGGAGVTNRNIISANGSNDYPHEQNTSDNLKFDWYNACGIYMFNVNNSTITNNYLGVGSSGNSYTSSSAYDLGNFYVGIKIDGNSINNKVGLAGAGNIIGGNGFRSSVAAAAAGLSSLDGHGIIIKDNGTSNTSVIGNYIGVGADGTSKIGNRQDGISVQGAKGTVIGGVLATERNVIGDNVWGIFIASNYWNSQSANTVVYGNYIGVNAAGTAEIGNGTRAGDTWGGGIGVTHYSQGTLVGGAATGQGNVISGNRTGISLLGNSPITPNGNGSTTSKVYGNLVGLAANGTTVIPNIENGIYISEKATGNDIGGLLAGQANRIVGNTSSGIYSDDASANNIVGNIISNNGQIGIGLNKTINNVVRGNTITGHSASGIVLQASSSGNRFLGNTIGDLTDATKANTGDGISITASANNIIGGVSAGEGNIIANNTGNGIYIAGATSNNNSIHRNQIACNGGRGIELNAVANSNYAKPVFSGTETALVITGPAGSFIELYSLDACNNCSDLTNNKLQGRTLLTSGPSPLSYAGTVGVFYTATASAGSTTAAHNTSEFTSCYTLCPPSNLGLAVTSNSPVCVGNAAIVTITNSELGKEYQVFNGATSVSSKVIGTGANLPITLNALVANTYTLTIKVNSVGCLPTNLTQQPTVVINSSPNVGLAVTSNSPVCVGNAAIVTIVGSELNKTYEVYNGATSVSSVVTGTGGNLPITLNALTANTYTLTIRVGSGGCVTTNLTQQPTVVINSSPNVGLAVTSNSPVCVGNAAIVTIVGSELNKTYEVYNGATSVSSVVTGTGGNLPITLNALTANTYTLTIRVGSGGCVTTNLTQQPTVVINSSPNVGLAVTSNSPVCVGNAAIVTIVGSELNKTYEVYNGATSVSSVVTGTGGNLPITLNALTANTYTLTIRVGSGGCVTTNLTQQPTVVINSSPNVGLAVTSNSPVCVGNAAIVTIVGSELNKTYEVYNGATSVSSVVTGTGGNLPITLNALTANTYTLTIRVGSGGCVTTNLTQQPTVVINSSPNVGLAVTSNSPVCVGNAAIVTIVGSELNKTYEVYNGATSVSSVVTGTGGNLPITLNALTANTYTLTIRVGSGGCVTTNLTQQPTVVINSSPRVDSDVQTNTPICFGAQGILTVLTPEIGKSYQVFDANGVAVSPIVLSPAITALAINLNSIPVGTHTLSVRASVPGCSGIFTLTKTAPFVVNPGLNGALLLEYVPAICLGTNTSITIKNSQLNVEYQAFDDKDNAVLSSKIIGDGKDIVVNLLPLTAGDKVIYFKATIGGCGELRLGNAATIFVDTDVKKGLKATATSPICLGEKSVVTIEGSEAIKQYQVFEKGTAVSAKVKGTGIDLLIDVPNLKEGDHTFTIQVFSNGCKDDTLLQNPFTKVNSAPRTDLKVGTNGPVCAGNQAVFYIVKSEVGKKYEIFNTGTGLSVSSVAIGTGDTLKINLNNLNPGTYILSAKASSDGCASSVELIEKGTITINSIPRVDLTATVNGPVCLNAPAEVTVVKAEIGKSYQVFFKGQAVSAIGTGDGTDLKLTVTTTTMPAGIHDLAIAISVPGCTTDTLASKPKLTINKSPETGLQVSAVLSPICVNTDGAVQVFGIEPNVRYQAFIGLVDVSADLAGVGPNITLPILASKLKIGLNNISVKATISGCTSADLADTAGIVVNKEPNLGLLISADPLVICKGGESNLTIKGSELGVSYQAILSDGTTVSLSVPGNGKDTVLVVNGLPEGDNTIGVKASVAGCTDKKLNNTVLIKVNAGPKINYAVSGSTVCKGEAGFVNIDGSEIGTSYEAFNKTTNVSVSNAISGTGAAIKIDLFPSNNPVDTIIIKANVQGCGIVRLENQAVVITNDLSTSKTLPVKGDTICTNDVSATATILGAKKGVSYQAKVGSFTSDILVGNDADLVFTILRSNLNAGNNSMSFVATVQGCQPVTLDNQALIIVNDNTTSKDLATNGDIICVNDAEGTSIIKNAIVGVSYQAKVGVTLSVVKVGDGTDLEFIFLRSDLALGSNTVSFTASIAGCSPVDLSNNATIIVNDNISSKALRTNGDSVCVNELFATATIYAAKKGVTYLAYTGSTELASKTAVDDGDIVLSISVSKLSSGNNDIIFYAEVAGCDRIELDNKAKILVIGERYVISGKKSVCAFSKHTYTVNVIPGISNYNWTLPLGAEIVAGANTNEILVKFGAKSDSIKVSPVGVVGGCDALNGSLFVTVSDTLRDTLQIKGFDKVCVRDTNWVQLDPSVVRDANIVSWKWSKTIAHYDTSNQYVYYDTTLKDTVRAYTLLSEFKIGHPTVGIDTIIVTPYEGCSESFKTSLADTLFVRVLEYPVANAGVYQDIEAERFVLNLNGTGTSVEGIAPYDSVSYKWTTDIRDLQVINPDSLNKATVELKDEKTLVTLTVMNFGKCPVTDTARVVMKSSIDIPNVFSPNGDGNHDFFEIKNLNKLYPDAVLTIFNKWGSVVYVSGAGYPEPWDGKRNGEDMPVATYYYILDTKGGRTYSPGSVTIIR